MADTILIHDNENRSICNRHNYHELWTIFHHLQSISASCIVFLIIAHLADRTPSPNAKLNVTELPFTAGVSAM